MYTCENCGGNLTVKSAPLYHYTESGLENVYLENLEVEFCPRCQRTVPRFRRLPLLHETIGRALAHQPAPLAGAQVRYLRKHLAYKVREWATLLRVEAATASGWEAGEFACEPPADLLIRLTWLQLLAARAGAGLPDRLVEQLAMAGGQAGPLPLIVPPLRDINGTAVFPQRSCEDICSWNSALRSSSASVRRAAGRD